MKGPGETRKGRRDELGTKKVETKRIPSLQGPSWFQIGDEEAAMGGFP